MKLNVKVGADKDGTIKVIDIDALSDTGAYGEHASTTFGLVGEKTMPMYGKLNAARFKGNVVYTNKTPAGAFRGYGATQGCFAVESTINKLAAKLNMDPVDVRVRSVGMALTMQGSGIAGIDTASIEIKLNDDGNYTLLTGSTDMGTGSDTILAQMCAEVLETTMDKIVVNSADTDSSPYDPGSYASSTTYVTGMAVVKAATELKNKIVSLGAQRLELSEDFVEFDGEYVKSINKDKEISVLDLAIDMSVGCNKNQLIGYATHGSPVSPPPFIAGFVETEIDKETGKVEIIDYVAVVDCGTVINKNLAKIQVEGGIVQGIGMALYEDVVYTQRGELASNTFMQYKMPTRKDVGNIIVDFEESYEPTGPFGAKSVGEVVVNTPSPAIENAIYNGLGINLNTLPMTPEKVFMAMTNK